MAHTDNGEFRRNAIALEPGEKTDGAVAAGEFTYVATVRGSVYLKIGDADIELSPTGHVEIPSGREWSAINASGDPTILVLVDYRQDADRAKLASVVERCRGEAREELGQSRKQLQPPVVVCEIGCNHRGEMPIALEMIKIASQFCKVDVVKFQKRCNRELLTPQEYAAPHPNPVNSYGNSYGEHRERLEFDLDQHRQLRDACSEWDVAYATSVWDLTSAKEIASLEPQLIKIPSATNANVPLLEFLFKAYAGEIHVSLGMTLKSEEAALIELADRHGRLKDLVLYHCTSGYPVPADELFLKEISNLTDAYGAQVKAIGFSGHHNGISADIAALALGAAYFERHFTLDRTWKGTDHAASLEPDGMRRLARDLEQARRALAYKSEEISPIEVATREKLKKVVAA